MPNERKIVRLSLTNTPKPLQGNITLLLEGLAGLQATGSLSLLLEHRLLRCECGSAGQLVEDTEFKQ